MDFEQMVEETYLPQCLAIGIRADDFWNLNIRKLRPFLKAEELMFQQKNREMHIMGMYINEAVSVAIANAFRRSGEPAIPYSDKPYEFLTQEELDKRKRKDDAERLKAAFGAFAESTKTRLEHGH